MPTLASVSLNNPRLCSLIEDWIPLNLLIDSLAVQIDHNSIPTCQHEYPLQTTNKGNGHNCALHNTEKTMKTSAQCDCLSQIHSSDNKCDQDQHQQDDELHRMMPTQTSVAAVSNHQLTKPLDAVQPAEDHLEAKQLQQTNNLQDAAGDVAFNTESYDETMSLVPALPFRYTLHQRMPKPLILKVGLWFDWGWYGF
jgi:hypothetical protein